MEKIINQQEFFPWLKTFLDKFMKSFPDDCSEDLLQYLLENLNDEMKTTSTKHNRKRQKALFEAVLHLFLHCWWKIQWRRKIAWKKSWKKDYSREINYGFTTQYVAKLLYYIIYIGIKLSKGVSNSNWLNRILQAMQVFPDHNIICNSLLLIQKLKKKFQPSYYAILKNFLFTKVPKHNLDPVVYVKVMILFRKLKQQVVDANEIKEIKSVILKFQAPSSLMPWMTSYNLDVKTLKQENITQQLFKKSSRGLFEKLKLIIADLEPLSFETKQKDSKITKGRDSQINMDSNLLHSSKDPLSRVKKGKLKKSKSETTHLVKTDSLFVNENASLDFTPASLYNISRTLDENVKDVNIPNDETIDQLSSGTTQTSTLLQNISVINSDSQITADKSNLCSDNSIITRQEHVNSENLEQLCRSFTSDTNRDLNSNSGSILQNESMESPYSEGANDGSSESQSVNEKKKCNTTIEIGSNKLTFPQVNDKLHQSSNATCNENSLVMDWNFQNTSDPPQLKIRPTNPDASSIKVVINLNNKQCSSLVLQNEHLDRSNQLIKTFDSNPSGSSFFNHFNVPLRTASMPVVSQSDGYHSSLHKIDSHKTSRHVHHKIATPVFLSSIVNKRSDATALTQETLNSTQIKKNYFFSLPKPVPSTSQRRTSTDELVFHTPHTSDCEMYSDDENYFQSTPILKSSKGRLTKELESAPNSFDQQQQDDHHPGNDFSQHKANISSQNGSLQGKKCKSSASEIYSDASSDDSSESSIADHSYEESDQSFSDTSSLESPLKNKNLDFHSHSRIRTISTSSNDCHSNANNSCYNNKEYFCRLDSGKMNNLKRVICQSQTTNSNNESTKRQWTKKQLKPRDYNLRPRRSISRPRNLENFVYTLY